MEEGIKFQPLKIRCSITLSEEQIRAALSRTRLKVFKYLLSHPKSTVQEIATNLGLTRRQVYRALSDLEYTYVVADKSERSFKYSVNQSTSDNESFKELLEDILENSQ